MQTEYRRNLNKSYMIIYAEAFYSSYEMEMFSENRIDGFLDFETVVSNGKNQFWYDITGKQSLDSWLEAYLLTTEMLMRLVTQIYDISERIKPYLLNPRGVLLNPEGIYLTNDKEEVFFCYYPLSEQDIGMSFQSLMEYLIQKIDHKDEEAVQFGYKIYQWTLENSYSLKDIMERIKTTETEPLPEKWLCETPEEEEREKDDNKKQQSRGNLLQTLWKRIDLNWKQLINERTRQWKRKDLIHERENREERLILPIQSAAFASKTPTMDLGGKKERTRGELRYDGCNGEQNLVIHKSPYLIGTKEEQADGVLLSKAVSRLHAKIVLEEGAYYIEDLNSTNGTFVNDLEVNYKTPVILNPRDKIWFADAEYTFY